MDVLLTLFVYVAFGLIALAMLIGGVAARVCYGLLLAYSLVCTVYVVARARLMPRKENVAKTTEWERGKAASASKPGKSYSYSDRGGPEDKAKTAQWERDKA